MDDNEKYIVYSIFTDVGSYNVSPKIETKHFNTNEKCYRNLPNKKEKISPPRLPLPDIEKEEESGGLESQGLIISIPSNFIDLMIIGID